MFGAAKTKTLSRVFHELRYPGKLHKGSYKMAKGLQGQPFLFSIGFGVAKSDVKILKSNSPSAGRKKKHYIPNPSCYPGGNADGKEID